MENYAKFPILSNRQIYPEASRKTSPQKDFNGSTNSLNSDSNYGSRKFLNLIHDGQKFCLVQGDQNPQSVQGQNKFRQIIPVKAYFANECCVLTNFFENPFFRTTSPVNRPFRYKLAIPLTIHRSESISAERTSPYVRKQH